ncbi:MAG: biopolymer transporter ExbD [Proteobacteria bacterium]|nr:biopolymer transporter ExbD [Pseudomonadota bacterium]MBS0463351.1 biopolymer transporter ExbD [Pseudomonadota bacterium]
MAFSSSNSGGPIVDMNVTPLVDVMLVLLIIFMVTMPPMTYPVGVDLPIPSVNPPPPAIAPPITIKIDSSGSIAWNGTPVPLGSLRDQLQVEADRYTDPKQQPVIQIDTDPEAEYDVLAKVLAATKNAGMIKVGFVDKGG